MKWLKTTGLAVVLAAVAGCGDLANVNENPNAPEFVDAQYLLPAAVQSGANTLLGVPVRLSITNLWVQHLARLEYGYTDRYEFEADFSDDRWRSLWIGPLTDAQGIVNQGRDRNRPNVEAAGLVIKSWLFHNMTDLWGDMPYSEALQGEDGPLAPAYDTQEQIYAGILQDLKAAQDMIQPSASLFSNPTFDILYGGNMEGWRRFANSLRLRAGMRLSEVDPATAASVVASAIADGVIRSADEEARLEYPGSPPNENPIAENIRERPNDYRVSSTMVDSLKSFNDPRLPIYAEPARLSGEYVGKDNGTPDTHGIAFESVSRIGTTFLASDWPAWLMAYEEVLFLQAEAAARNWITADAGQLYADGIRAAMRRVGVAEADIDAYLADPRVAYDPARWREQIALQKWIALYDQSPEAYAEFRRLDYPVLTAGPGNVNDGVVPVRLPYPSVEQDLNTSNLAEARSRQGGDGPKVHLWWDVD